MINAERFILLTAVAISMLFIGFASLARPGDAQAQDGEAQKMVREQIMWVRQKNSRVDLYVDRITGCHYWVSSQGGLTPRMNADGTQLCSELPG